MAMYTIEFRSRELKQWFTLPGVPTEYASVTEAMETIQRETALLKTDVGVPTRLLDATGAVLMYA